MDTSPEADRQTALAIETNRPVDAAYTLHVQGRLAEAEALYRKIAAGDHPQDAAHARNNLLVLLRDQHRWDEAEAVIREALAARPDDADMTYRLASSVLARGDYAQGWPLYEARRRITRKPVRSPALTFPEWDGGAVRSLVVWQEQGFGDIIQFSRYLPLLRDRQIHVTLVCGPLLAPLLAQLADRTIVLEVGAQIPMADAWTMLASLPLKLGVVDGVPGPGLKPAPAGGEGIGIVTRGRTDTAQRANRSLPDDLAQRLLGLPGAVSLAPEDTGAADFQATADIIAGLRGVISVDTASAHLAASLGKPTAVLIPYLNPDWRWGRTGASSPWYPAATLYRQTAPDLWPEVVDRVSAEFVPGVLGAAQ